MLTAVGASVWASGNQVCTGQTGSFTAKAVNIRPDFKSGWRKLTKVYRAQDKDELMVMALSRILEIDSEDESALWERAEAHYESKKLGDSMGDIHKLLALNPGNQKARKFKAMILEKLDAKEWE